MLRGLSTLLLLIVLAGEVAAACPTWESAPKGFVLKRVDGTTIEVTGRANGLVSVIERPADPKRPVAEKAFFRGLVASSSRSSGTAMVIEYDKSPLTMFPLAYGAVHDFKYRVTPPGAAELTASLGINVATEPSSVGIGTCVYGTIAVTKAIRFSNGNEISMQDFWSEALELVVRSNVSSRMPGGEPIRLTYEFTSIEPRP